MNQRPSVQTSGIENGMSPKVVEPEEEKKKKMIPPEIYPSYFAHSRQAKDGRGVCVASRLLTSA